MHGKRRQIGIAAALLLAACASGTPPGLGELCTAPAADAGQISAVETGNADFGLALYGALSDGGTGGNLVISPYSISTALDLAYAGAATQTATQMSTVLGLGSASANPGPAVAHVACQVETDGSSAGNRLDIANALYGQQGMTFAPAFLTLLRTNYGAPLQQVDFKDDPSAALTTINDWVAGITQNMIPKLLGPSDVTADTRLVLVNALYFKGEWESGFNPSQTQTLPFNLGGAAGASTQVSAPLMTQSGSFGWMRDATAGLAVAELQYKGGKTALDIVLPDQISGLPALSASLTASQLDGWLSKLVTTPLAALTIPKFTLDTHVELAPPLQALGMPLAFQAGVADFSSIDGQHDLFIQAVVHEAVIDVDETGTTAAAATAVSVATDAVAEGPTLTFIADHPFLFVLRDLPTGTILFLGQVNDPTQP